ncbi:MAG: hypothetical protein JXR91_04440 [Deltaproteobacteria bacterium]|nr:hypothetical protein [Deltaproteobacteria bacterium]
MILVDQTKLKSFIRYIDAKLDHPVSLYIAGGSAVVILCPDAQSTKDIDTFSSNELLLIKKINKSIPPDISLDINNGINTFEAYLPDDWKNHSIHSSIFSGKYLQIYTLCPEDLVLMKTFRFNSKDAQDIEKLLALDSFNKNKYKKRFMEMFRAAPPGQPIVHAGSFAMIWKKIHPGSSITAQKILKLADLE